MNMLRILIADDHHIVRQGLKALLEREQFDVCADTADGQEAVRLARELRPDVAVLDFAMPLLNGLEATREIHLVSPQTQTILLTMHAEDRYVQEALRAGARGYVVKTQVAADLVQAIREVSRGRIYLCTEVSGAVVDAYLAHTDAPADPLTSRERQVLQLVAEGKTTKEIAQLLGVSVKTADTHRTRIMDKLSIHNTAGLVRYAIRRGVIEL
jgi:two-component system, NarL family, response regulator NreC